MNVDIAKYEAIKSTATGFQYFKGIDYIKIDIANQYGLDKLTWEARIQFVDDHHNVLEELYDTADECELFYKAVCAYREAMIGIPNGHTVGIDACFSGMQIVSALLGCMKSAEAVGLIDPTIRKDVYTKLPFLMNALMQGMEAISVSRKEVKDCLMPGLYGSTIKAKEIFGENSVPLQAYHKAINEEMPAYNVFGKVMTGRWNEGALFHQWTLPDGHVAHVKVIRKDPVKCQVKGLGYFTHIVSHNAPKGKKEKGAKANQANVVQSIDAFIVAEMQRRCNYNTKKVIALKQLLEDEIHNRNIHSFDYKTVNKQFLATNYIFDITPTNIHYYNDNTIVRAFNRVLWMLEHKSFPVLQVFDQFNAHPNNCNRLRENYAHILAEICESEMFEDIFEELTGIRPNITKDAGLADIIRTKANYHLS